MVASLRLRGLERSLSALVRASPVIDSIAGPPSESADPGTVLQSAVIVTGREHSRRKPLVVLLALGSLLLASAGPLHAADYLLATASTGGTYYPVGVALGTLTKIKLKPEHGLSLTAITSAGSAENIRLLRKGEVG